MSKTDPAFDRPCSVCGAPAGEGCRDDDGVPQPKTSMHIGRVTGGKPLVVRLTGELTRTAAASSTWWTRKPTRRAVTDDSPSKCRTEFDG